MAILLYRVDSGQPRQQINRDTYEPELIEQHLVATPIEYWLL